MDSNHLVTGNARSSMSDEDNGEIISSGLPRERRDAHASIRVLQRSPSMRPQYAPPPSDPPPLQVFAAAPVLSPSPVVSASDRGSNSSRWLPQQHTLPGYIPASGRAPAPPQAKSVITEAPPWKELSLIFLKDGAHGFDQAAQDTITQFINPVRQTGQPRKQASLEEILHVVQQDLDQQKNKPANTPPHSLLNHYLNEDTASVKAYQAYALVHGREYIEKTLKPALELLQSHLIQSVADKDTVPITKIADVAQAVLDNLAHGKAGYGLPDPLCMLLAALPALFHAPDSGAMQAEAGPKEKGNPRSGPEVQFALLHELFMIHLLPKHLAMRDNQACADSDGQALRRLMKMLRSATIINAYGKQLTVEHELKLNNKSSTVLPVFYTSVLTRGRTLLEQRLKFAVETNFSPAYSRLVQGVRRGEVVTIIHAARALIRAPNSFMLVAVATGKIKSDEIGYKTEFITDLLKDEYQRLSADERKSLQEKLGAAKTVESIAAALPNVAIRFMDDRPELARDMSAASALLTQLHEHINMQDPQIGGQSQGASDPGRHALATLPVSREMENAIAAAFQVSMAPAPAPASGSKPSSSKEDRTVSLREMLLMDPAKLKGDILQEDAEEAKKAGKKPTTPRTSGSGGIRGLARNLSLKASGATSSDIAASPGTPELKAPGPASDGSELTPPYPFLANQPPSWKRKDPIVDGSSLLPFAGQTRLTVDELDEVTRTMIHYFINPFRETGDLSAFLGGSSRSARTTRDIRAIRWVNENAVTAVMHITEGELAREAGSPGKTVEQLLATIFRESSLATAAFEAAMSHYGKKYADRILKPAWQKLEAALRVAGSNGVSLSIDKTNLNDDSTAGKVRIIHDIVLSVVESMSGATDPAISKDTLRAASEAVPDKICMLLSGITRQVTERAFEILEKAEAGRSPCATPEALAARRSAVEAQARASIPTALLMLRLMGPAVFNRAINLIPDHQRVVILISKVLQAVGNGASRQNDPVTHQFSAFIESCQLHIQAFFGALLARGDLLFTQTKAYMDVSALSAEKRAAAAPLAAKVIALIPRALQVIPASDLNTQLSDEEILAGLLRILLLPEQSTVKVTMRPAPQPGAQPQPARLAATLCAVVQQDKLAD